MFCLTKFFLCFFFPPLPCMLCLTTLHGLPRCIHPNTMHGVFGACVAFLRPIALPALDGGRQPRGEYMARPPPSEPSPARNHSTQIYNSSGQGQGKPRYTLMIQCYICTWPLLLLLIKSMNYIYIKKEKKKKKPVIIFKRHYPLLIRRRNHSNSLVSSRVMIELAAVANLE